MKKYKCFWVFLFLLVLTVGNAQGLGERQQQKLLNLGISYDTLWQDQEQYNADLLLALKKHRRHKKNKVIGSILGGVGLVSVTTGVLLLSQKKENQNFGNGEESDFPLRDFFGGVVLASGALEIGVSIPFFITAKKRKRERTILLEKYKITN